MAFGIGITFTWAGSVHDTIIIIVNHVHVYNTTGCCSIVMIIIRSPFDYTKQHRYLCYIQSRAVMYTRVF